MREESWRDAAASDLAARHAPGVGLSGPVLVMEDPLPTLASTFVEQGFEVHRYWRRALEGRPAEPWPSGGPYGTVALRLPRARDELRMLVHATVGLMEAAGHLLLYGAKDEGAGSMDGKADEVFRSVETVATGKRCRLLVARSPRRDSARTLLDDWSLAFAPGLEELGPVWVSFPGVFAHGRLDGGTELLLETMPALEEGVGVLDFGCGHGVVGATVAARAPGAEVTYLDVDALALEAVKRNVPGARTLLSDGWSGAGNGAWDVVVSNPPWHTGKPETLRVVEELIRGAARRVTDSGWLALVSQRRLRIGSRLESHFHEVEVLGDRGVWRVWRARQARRNRWERP